MQDSLELAIFSIVGGFLAPILASFGDGNYKLLFGYYALLNVGIFIISYKKAWRILNWIGFVFTFVIGTAWGVLRYSPDKFAVSEGFLLFNFLLYLSISIFFAQNKKYNPKGIIDTTLTFGLPTVVFSLQYALVGHIAHGYTISSSAFALLYFGLWFVFRGKKALLAQAYFAIGVIFTTMVIAYHFSQNVTSILWALEGSLVIWLAIKQDRKISRYFGELILLVSSGMYLVGNTDYDVTIVRYFGFMLISISLTFASLNLKNIALDFDRNLDRIFLSAAIAITVVQTSSLLDDLVAVNCGCMMASILMVAIVLYTLNQWFRWEYTEDILHAYIPVGLAIMVLEVLDFGSHNAISSLNVLISLLYIGFGYWLLSKMDPWVERGKLHILNFLFLDLLLTHALIRLVHLPYRLDYVLPSMVLAMLLESKISKRLIVGFEYEYRHVLLGALIVFSIGWQLMANHYMPEYSLGFPLFNVLEFVQIVVLLLVAYYAFRNGDLPKAYTLIAKRAFWVLSFVFVTVVYARAVAHYVPVPYGISLAKNSTFQAGLSIIWSMFGVVCMLLSKRYAHRALWATGMALLSIVVVKLFLVDLANSATIQRVVSFMGVGVLMLLIGYFVPMPPRKKESNEEQH